MRVLDAVKDVAERIMLGDKEVSAGQLAERLGFTPARQRTPVGDLSGGERRRLQLTRVLMAEPNVLLLDEPTNDLDIDTLQQLEDLLDGWAGTLVVISHDRFLIERICDSTWALFGDGKLTNLPGGIEEYLRRRAAMGDEGVVSVASTVSKPGDTGGRRRRSATGQPIGRLARNSHASNGRSPSSTSARRSCTSGWPRPLPIPTSCRSSTRSCVRWSRRRKPPRSSGWSSPKTWADLPRHRVRSRS